MIGWSPAQRQALEAMGFQPLRRIAPSVPGEAPTRLLADVELPRSLRDGLERWMGPAWQQCPAPPGRFGDAAFKRALWRRIRDWRRGA